MFATPEQGESFFWENINKPFLDAAIKRRQTFKIFDDPQGSLIFKDSDPSKGLSFFGKEIEYLRKNNYIIKDGVAKPK